MNRDSESAQRRFGLLRHPDFVKLWAGQSISALGSRVTFLALPLTAVLTLHATSTQMGLLLAMEGVPILLIGLPGGVWVDRRKRRPLMIAADLGQAAILLSIPLASWLGMLRLGHLYLVALLAGALSVLSAIAAQSYLPTLLPSERLADANGKLEVSASTAQLAGPGIGGALVQTLTAPIAILADAVSFVLSAVCLTLIRSVEPPSTNPAHRNFAHEVAEGLRVVWNDRLLRALAAASATFNLFDNVLVAVYILYMSRSLGLSAAVIGLIFGLAGAGGLLGALIAAPIATRLGLGRTIGGGVVLAIAGELSIAAARGHAITAVLILIAAEAFVELGSALYGVTTITLRQTATPVHLQGRVSATMRVATQGVGPLGALIGGVLGATIGLRATIVVAGTGTLLSLVWLVLSPVRGLRRCPVASV